MINMARSFAQVCRGRANPHSKPKLRVVIHTGPNDISVIDPESVKSVLGTDGLGKGPGMSNLYMNKVSLPSHDFQDTSTSNVYTSHILSLRCLQGRFETTGAEFGVEDSQRKLSRNISTSSSTKQISWRRG